MRRDLQNSRMLITGAANRVGCCLAEQAVAAGVHLVLTDCTEVQGAEFFRGLGSQTLFLPADLSNEGERQRMLGRAMEHLGGLDVLVNNATLGNCAPFAESNEPALRRVMEVNFFAPAEIIRLAIPFLERGRLPVIVNVVDMCGRRGWPSWSEYSASKFALCGLTEALRGEMARFDIDVLLIVLDDPAQGLQTCSPSRAASDLPAAGVASCILASLQHNRAETVVGHQAR